jgi:flagellar motility protein MotE (MotC chaperone)
MIRNTNPYAKPVEPEQKKPAARLSPLKVLLAAVVVNLMFLGAYFSLDSLSASAAEDKAAQAAPRKEPAQDTRAQMDSLKQREELLRVRQRELQMLESRIDEKIKRLSALETNVKAEIAMYKGISDERTKHLVKIYSSMKPNAAAKLMDQMDIDVATEVFLSMKGEIAGGILAYMEPAKAAAISKRLMSTRKMTSSAPQAVPQSAPQGQAKETPATAMTEPGPESGAMAQVESIPAAKPAPKAKARSKAWAKAKHRVPSAQVAAKTAPQEPTPLAAVPATEAQTAPQGAAPQLVTKPAQQGASPQTAAKPAAPSATPPTAVQPAPQASAVQGAPKSLSQVLAQTVPGGTEQK